MMEFGSSNRGNERKSAGGLHRAISMKAKMVKMTGNLN
jgi:hypothetical protein